EVEVPERASATAEVGSLAAVDGSTSAAGPPPQAPPDSPRAARGVPWDRLGLGLLAIGALAALPPSGGDPERSRLARRGERGRRPWPGRPRRPARPHSPPPFRLPPRAASLGTGWGWGCWRSARWPRCCPRAATPSARGCPAATTAPGSSRPWASPP